MVIIEFLYYLFSHVACLFLCLWVAPGLADIPPKQAFIIGLVAFAVCLSLVLVKYLFFSSKNDCNNRKT